MVIKAVKKINPLANCGNIVYGDRFIGRESEIEIIQNRVLVKNGGNIAIMGLPRVGKSSLVWNALMTKKEEALKQNILIVRLNIGDLESADEFNLQMIIKIYEEIEDVYFEDKNFMTLLEKRVSVVKDKQKESIEKKSAIERFFKIINKKDISIILILDEFDHITSIFKLENFQFLREISINPDMSISIVSISRKTISEIEVIGNATLSKLSTVFADLNLGLFKKEEVDIYWKQLENFGIQTDNEYREKVLYFTGNHPFLIDMFNYEMINEILSNDTDIIDTMENLIKLKLYNQYDYIIAQLKEENLYDKLIQILFGPIYDLDAKSIERLVKFGIIAKNNEKYKVFSEFFQEYLSLKQNEIDFWPLWSETESLLRKLIKKVLYDVYGEDWEEKFIKKHGKEERLKSLSSMKERNLKNFPQSASTHLVDYTYPLDMYNIFISSDWSTIYCNIFEGKKQKWGNIFNFLAKIRNPIAHNNDYFLSDSDKNLAISYCEEIISILNKYFNKI